MTAILRHKARAKAIRTGEMKIGSCVYKTVSGVKPSKPFSLNLRRLREIELIIETRYGKFIPETDDADTIIEVAAYALNAYCRTAGKDMNTVLGNWCHRWCPWVLPVAADVLRPILQRVEPMRKDLKADDVAKRLHVCLVERKRLKLRTIGAHDIDPVSRREIARFHKRALDRDRQAAKRRLAGVLPRDLYEAKRSKTSLSASKPWEAEGISRATWFRRKRATLRIANSIFANRE